MTIHRRHCLQAVSATAGLMLIPRHILGRGFTAPSDKLNLAGIGVGGVGKSYLENLNSENIVALCDVDEKLAAEVFSIYPSARRYRDYRELLDRESEIDAVVIGTPDHSHAVIAMAALKKHKHIYCAKPLTRTIYEARKLAEAARKAGVATQMSTQTNASEDHRLICEWIWDGAIGKVRAVEIWSNRPIWPQGVERPQDTPPVPDGLDWDLWLGPAPERPYHPAYHPFQWRGWWDFGTGAIGDMGCHGFDPIFKALKLGHPTSVHASSTKIFPETAPLASAITFDFPARGNMPPVRVTWSDGGIQPPRPRELEDGRPMGNWDGGIFFHGDKGILKCEGVGGSPRLIPESRMRAYKRPSKKLPRSIGHYQEFIRACKGGPSAAVEWGYGGLLTEVVLLGHLAVRMSGKKLYWDPAALKITNDEEANRHIREPCRPGWSL